MLCNKFELPEERVVGMAMILGPAEGETIPESAEVQKAALQVSDIESRLMNCKYKFAFIFVYVSKSFSLILLFLHRLVLRHFENGKI